MLKSFDFFRKIQTDQELTSTTGGVFTIVALIVVIYSMQVAGILIFLSLQDFYQEKYYTFLAVKNDDAEFLPMRIDVTFNKLPCQGTLLFIQLQEFSSEMNLNIWKLEFKQNYLCLECPKMEILKKNIKEVKTGKYRKSNLLLT